MTRVRCYQVWMAVAQAAWPFASTQERVSAPVAPVTL
jgi:hypothetical protein